MNATLLRISAAILREAGALPKSEAEARVILQAVAAQLEQIAHG